MGRDDGGIHNINESHCTTGNAVLAMRSSFLILLEPGSRTIRSYDVALPCGHSDICSLPPVAWMDQYDTSEFFYIYITSLHNALSWRGIYIYSQDVSGAFGLIWR